MPTYEYKCFACGHTFERFQSITAEPIKRCPECGKAKVRRLLGTGAGLIFKGSGFYITDYRDSSYKEKAKSESGGSSTPDAKGEKSGSKSGDKAAPAGESKQTPKAPPSTGDSGSSKPAGSTPPKKKGK